MRRRKKSPLGLSDAHAIPARCLPVLLGLLVAASWPEADSMLLAKSNCLASSPACECLWKGGKFVADCSAQGLTSVPKNDHSDSSPGMATLKRDIQQLALTSNNLSSLEAEEFYRKKFYNLQKIQLNANQIACVHHNAFRKLVGLMELDLSENLLSSLEEGARPEGVRGRLPGKSFLQDLSQLRQLNLASNRLRQLSADTFSPLSQLRQLDLSRNEIEFIDKRAFEGLNVLNILHLESLWTEAARQPAKRAKSAPNDDGSLSPAFRPTTRNILQDEPRCFRATSGGAGPNNWRPRAQSGAAEGAPEGGEEPLWRNMGLADFECPPRLADELLAAGSEPAVWSSMGDDENVMNDKTIRAKGERKRRELQFYLANEPLELTCAFELADELDLELQQLEWWLLQPRPPRRTLLWRSQLAPLPAGRNDTRAEEAPTRASEFAVLDYLTRTNGSDCPPDDCQEMPASGFVRVTHLLAASAIGSKQQAQASDRSFLCRLSDGRGNEAALLQEIQVGGGDQRALAAARAREARRKRLLVNSAGSNQQALVSALALQRPPQQPSLHEAKRALAQAMEEATSGGQPGRALFVPLELPQSFFGLDEEQAKNQTSGPEAIQDHQRPSTRNASALGTGGGGGQQLELTGSRQTHSASQSSVRSTGPEATIPLGGGSSRQPLQRLQSSGLALITRYTSNKAYLIADNSEEELAESWQPSENESQQEGLPAGVHSGSSLTQLLWPPKNEQRSFGTRVKVLASQFYSRHLDRWLQMAIGRAPLLLAICSGLLFGFLLSMAILLRLRCTQIESQLGQISPASGRRKKVYDSSKSDYNSEQDDDNDEAEEDDRSSKRHRDSYFASGSNCASPNEKEGSKNGSSSSTRTAGSEQRLLVPSRGLDGYVRESSSNQASAEDDDMSALTLDVEEGDSCVSQLRQFQLSGPEKRVDRKASCLRPTPASEVDRQEEEMQTLSRLFGLTGEIYQEVHLCENPQLALERPVGFEQLEVGLLPVGEELRLAAKRERLGYAAQQCQQSSCGEDQLTATTLDQDSSSSLLLLQPSQLPRQQQVGLLKSRPPAGHKQRRQPSEPFNLRSSPYSFADSYSPAASTSGSSSAAAVACSYLLPSGAPLNQQASGGQPQSLVYLEDALQLLNVSMSDCLQFNHNDCDTDFSHRM